MQATDYVRSLWKFIHVISMIRTGTTVILGHCFKGQGQLWYFVCETLLARTRLYFIIGLLTRHQLTSHAPLGWDDVNVGLWAFI